MTGIKDNTEQRIFSAAMKVFVDKGFDGARMQEIADEAGINKSLLHYYYRSKEKLFMQVFAKISNGVFSKFFEVFESVQTIHEKIKAFSDGYIDFLIENPKLPIFMLNEMRLHPQLISEAIKEANISTKVLVFMKEINIAMQKGEIRKMNAHHLLVNIISMLIFPIAAKNLISSFLGIDEKGYQSFILERKNAVPEFVIHSISK